MGNNSADISAAANRNILIGIADRRTNRNAIANKAGIPRTTFDRKVDGHGDFTIRELGAIADALERGLGDIVPKELLIESGSGNV